LKRFSLVESASLNSSFFQFGVLIFVSLLLGDIVSWLGFPSVIGYLLAGFALGPGGIGFVSDQTLITYLSELGVLLLLFYMGLEISMKKFSRAGIFALFLTPIKSGFGFALGFLVARWLGLPSVLAIVFGASLAVSSTAIISQIILERKMQDALESQIAIAMLILEDIISVFVIGYLLGAEGGISVGKVLLNSVVILLIMFILGTRLSKKILAMSLRLGGQEFFSLYAFALLLIFAYGVSYVGMSPLLGAFFAGMLLSETVHAHKIEEELAALRRLFVLIFFTSLGLRYTITFGSLALKLTLFGFIILLLQKLVLFLFAPVFGVDPRKSARLSILMFPLGEFSLFTAAAIQSINFSSPEALHYFGLTPQEAALIHPLAAELMGATFALIVITTVLSGLIFKREEAIEEFLLRHRPSFVDALSRRLAPYFAAGRRAQRVATSSRFALLVERKFQRILELVLSLILLAYIMGYAASQYPQYTLYIYLIGYLLALYPLSGISRAMYALLSRYAEEMVKFSGFPRQYNRTIAMSIAHVFMGITLFVMGILFLAAGEGLGVVTFHLLSFLLIAASVGFVAYGIIHLFRVFLEPVPVSSGGATARTRRRGSSASRKRA